MDPISITAAVAGLTAFCFTVAKTVQDMEAKYRGANAMISAICQESSLLAISLSQMQELLQADPEAFLSAMKAPGLEVKLDSILTGCFTVFKVLQNVYVQDLQHVLPNLGFRARFRYFWDRNPVQDILSQLRGMQTGLIFLLSILQSFVFPCCSWMQS